MIRYRKIAPCIWRDEKFTLLNRDEMLTVFYVLTAQSNKVGLFSFSPSKAAEDLKLRPGRFTKCFKKVLKTFHWEWDPTARVLYIPTWFKYDQPQNPKNLIGILKDVEEVPENRFDSAFAMNLTWLEDETLRQTFTETFLKRYPKRIPIRIPKGTPSPNPILTNPNPTQADPIRSDPEDLNGSKIPMSDRTRAWGEKKSREMKTC